MIVTYQGKDSFKISQGELSLGVNPQSKSSADVTLFTLERGEVSDKSGFIIDGPGEYEVKDIFIKGFPDRTFLITFEGMKLCFLGSGEKHEGVEDVDILFVPVEAYKSAVALEPSIMIPMNYNKDSLGQFLREAGAKDVEPLDKLVIKKKDLEGKEGEVILLKEE